ncbi:hypothetical protein MKW98_023474 [Papaver atlanticum]|uniref:Uncharacterized protein n=1 Tax=Papaver atlanticum TaxID=357466 RepID=A0AAD4SWR5_9MAGN|nr:hypothetical protein MKW98_023474 [Papaver atlanticum]
MTIVTEPKEKKSVVDKVEEAQPAQNNFSMADSSVRMPEKNEWDEFGNDLYAMPEVLLVQSGNPMMDARKDCHGILVIGCILRNLKKKKLR